MRNLVVVVGQPSLGVLAHFGEMAEDVHVEHAASEAAIEAFDKAVLHRPSNCNVPIAKYQNGIFEAPSTMERKI